MTSDTGSAFSTSHPPWKWFFALGVLLLVLGVAGVGAESLLQFTSVLIFGPMLLASSLLQFLLAIAVEHRKERLLHLAAAGAEMVLGFLIMAHPIVSSLNLIVLVAALLSIAGILRLAYALAEKSRPRGWTMMAGVVALLLGISVWTGWPTASLWFVGLCIAIDFICHGVSWLGLAAAEKNVSSVAKI